MREERGAVRRLVDAALAEGGEAGVRVDPERAASTIHAANADEGLRADLAAGRLERWARGEPLGGVRTLPRPSRGGGRGGAERERRRKAELREAMRRVESARKRNARAAEKAEKGRRELARLEEAERSAAAELEEVQRSLERLGRE